MLLAGLLSSRVEDSISEPRLDVLSRVLVVSTDFARPSRFTFLGVWRSSTAGIPQTQHDSTSRFTPSRSKVIRWHGGDESSLSTLVPYTSFRYSVA